PDEIIERVLFSFQHPRLVPLLAELAAAAGTDLCIHTAVGEKREAKPVERRRKTGPKAAIPVQHGRIVAIERKPLAVTDEHRYVGSVRGVRSMRSEEHTSELQSRLDLVCR